MATKDTSRHYRRRDTAVTIRHYLRAHGIGSNRSTNEWGRGFDRAPIVNGVGSNAINGQTKSTPGKIREACANYELWWIAATFANLQSPSQERTRNIIRNQRVRDPSMAARFFTILCYFAQQFPVCFALLYHASIRALYYLALIRPPCVGDQYRFLGHPRGR